MSIIDLFSEAIEISDPDERMTFVERACGDDLQMLHQVRRMLEQYYDPKSFMSNAAIDARGGAVDKPSLPSEKAGDQIGPYKLLEQIGEGGMGVIYMAEQREPMVRRVALKIIKWGMDTKQVLARFEAERQALAMMNHPNIARILDAGSTSTGRSYFVMELVQGHPITEYCNRYKLETGERLRLFTEVCQAVQHAHQKGIIHRDIKPNNVLVTCVDDRPVPKVIDFGIAKATEQRLTEKTLFTQFHHFIGTPAYMSPEQAQIGSLDIDTRSDVYSLGVLLYEILTGQPPFSNEELMSGGYDEIRRRIRESEPLIPSRKLSSLSEEERTVISQDRRNEPHSLDKALKGELDWILMKALEKDRGRRFESANALRCDIDRYLKGELISAVAPSAWYYFQKLAKRHQAALYMIGLGLVLLALTTVISLSGWQKAGSYSEELSQSNESLQEETKRLLDAEQKAGFEKYLATIRGAFGLVEDYRVREAQLLLTNAIPTAGNRKDYRGIEWGFLWEKTQTPPGVKILKGHRHLVSTVEYSPDGRFVASGSRDKRTIVWDLATGQQAHEFEHTSWVSDVHWSPDSRQLVTVSAGQAEVWDVDGALPTLRKRIPLGRQAGLLRERARFLPDHRLGFSIDPEGDETEQRVVFYDVAAGRATTTITNAGRFVQFSWDGQWMLTETTKNRQTVGHLWRLSDPPMQARQWVGEAISGFSDQGVCRLQPLGFEAWPYHEVIANGFDGDPSPEVRHYGAGVPLLDGAGPLGNDYYVAARFENKYLWRAETGELVAGLPASNGSAFDWSLPRREIAMAEGFGEHHDLCLIPLASLDRQTKLTGLDDALAFDRRSMAIHRPNQSIQIVDLESMQIRQTLDLIDDRFDALGFLEEGQWLIAQDDEKKLLVRIEVTSGEVRRQAPLLGRIHSVEVSPLGKFVAFVFADLDDDDQDERQIMVLNATSFEVVYQEEIVRSPDALWGHAHIRFSDDDQWVGVVPDFYTLHVYDTGNWKRTLNVQEQHNVLGFAGNNTSILTWDTEAWVVKTDLASGEVQRLFHTAGGQAPGVLSPDEKTLIMGGGDGYLRFWNLESGFLMGETDLKERIMGVSIALDGRMILTKTHNPVRAGEGLRLFSIHYARVANNP